VERGGGRRGGVARQDRRLGDTLDDAAGSDRGLEDAARVDDTRHGHDEEDHVVAVHLIEVPTEPEGVGGVGVRERLRQPWASRSSRARTGRMRSRPSTMEAG
jgi:hypothetical protein